MDQFIFIIMLLVILVVIKTFRFSENFMNQDQNQSGGIYNYFHMQVMNPYEYPMTKFFSNDSQEPPKQNLSNPKY